MPHNNRLQRPLALAVLCYLVVPQAVACDPEGAEEAETHHEAHALLVDCDPASLPGAALSQLAYTTLMLATPNDDADWEKRLRVAFDLFLLGARKGDFDSITSVADTLELGEPLLGVSPQPKKAKCLMDIVDRFNAYDVIDPVGISRCLDSNAE